MCLILRYLYSMVDFGRCKFNIKFFKDPQSRAIPLEAGNNAIKFKPIIGEWDTTKHWGGYKIHSSELPRRKWYFCGYERP